MSGRIRTTIEREDLTKRVHNRIMRDVMGATGGRHMRRRVGKHFSRNRETAPGGPFGYDRRGTRTRAVKKELGVDPDRPNYKSGRMKAHMQGNSKLTRTKDRWSWSARSPFALNIIRRQELEAISRGEIADDTKFMERDYVRRARLPANRRKRRTRVG